MEIFIVRIYKIIIVKESTLSFLTTCIIRWVDVDYINLASMSVGKLCKCSEVVALDNEMIRSVGII